MKKKELFPLFSYNDHKKAIETPNKFEFSTLRFPHVALLKRGSEGQGQGSEGQRARDKGSERQRVKGKGQRKG